MQQAVRYDRRVSADFLDHFLPDGFAEQLTLLARDALYPLDLQMRKDPKTGAQHATLYAGLTAVLKVEELRSGLVKLSAHSTHRKNGRFDEAWSTPADADIWRERWSEVEMYLERVIPGAVESHGRSEGAVQAAVASHRAADRAVLDREVLPAFESRDLREQVLAECAGPILAALASADSALGKAPTSLGAECDALALHEDGRVLAVEIKPLGGGSVTWVAAQAIMYARVLQHWVDYGVTAGDGPREVLLGMLRQRQSLGLAPDLSVKLPDALAVTPVVALQRGARPALIERMLTVRDLLAKHDLGVPPVEIFEVSLTGRLIPLEESRRPDGTVQKRAIPYAARENVRAVAWKERTGTLPDEARVPGRSEGRNGSVIDRPFCLPAEFASYNLLPEVRTAALELFKKHGIVWHRSIDGGPTNHLRSSQVQCVNALGRMMDDPARITAAFGHVLDIDEVVPVEDDRNLTFEYVGPRDYFGEGRNGVLTRGSNCTSVDAAFAFRTPQGTRELALVEWKYTETYGRPDLDAARSRYATRLSRYGSLIDAPDGPVDRRGVPVAELFHEPLYQLVRQQLLADRLEKDPDVPFDVVRVVHVLSPDNRAYQASYVGPQARALGGDVDAVWRRLLRRPDRFVKLDPQVFLDPAVTSEEYVARYGPGVGAVR